MEGNWSFYPKIGLRSTNLTNTTTHLQESFEIDLEDTNWILTSSFIIFTMQTGFGMLESGCVSIKNEANIMMKNVADIVLGGLTYWMFGYGMSFGQGPYTNPFIGLGDFLVDPPVGDELMGPVFAAFLFQLSFATTATTIVSGAMAERCNFKAYCVFSLLNTVVYCIPAGWVWGDHGWLNRMGAVDIAGSGPVHLIGGAASFASALMLGPRLGRYANGTAPLPLGSPVNAVMGLFVLWWGWLAFNSGSTYGVSGAKWQYAARAAVITMMGSFGGGCFGLGYTMVKNEGRADVMDLINSILGSLVAITGCFLYRAWEALQIGFIGGAVASLSAPLFDKIHVDGRRVRGARPLRHLGFVRPKSAFHSKVNVCTYRRFLWMLHLCLSGVRWPAAGCFLYRAWEALLIGFIGGAVASLSAPLFDKIRVDDPVGASAVHGCCGIWGVIAVGLFADNPIPMDTTKGRSGLFKGGGWYLLGVQSLAALSLCVWGIAVTMLLLWVIDRFLPIRMDPYEELLGADLTEHRIRHGQVGVSRAVSALRPFHKSGSIEDVTTIGVNTGHMHIVERIHDAHIKKKNSLPSLKTYVNRAYNGDAKTADPNPQVEPTRTKNHGFLNKRPGNPENEFHRTLDSLGDIHGPSGSKNFTPVTGIVPPEDVKRKKLRELTPSQLDNLNMMAVNEDRFRYRFNEEDYEKDVRRANIAWLD